MTVETTNPVVWEITDCERCIQLVMDWEGSREIYEITGVFSVVGTCWNPSVEEKHGIQDGVSPKCPFPNPFPPWIWDHFVDFGAISWPRTAALIILSSGRQFVKVAKSMWWPFSRNAWFQICRVLLEDCIRKFLSLPPVWRCQFGPQQKEIFASFPLRGRAENLRSEDKLAQCQDIPTTLWAGSSKKSWLVLLWLWGRASGKQCSFLAAGGWRLKHVTWYVLVTWLGMDLGFGGMLLAESLGTKEP